MLRITHPLIPSLHEGRGRGEGEFIKKMYITPAIGIYLAWL